MREPIPKLELGARKMLLAIVAATAALAADGAPADMPTRPSGAPTQAPEAWMTCAVGGHVSAAVSPTPLFLLGGGLGPYGRLGFVTRSGWGAALGASVGYFGFGYEGRAALTLDLPPLDWLYLAVGPMLYGGLVIQKSQAYGWGVRLEADAHPSHGASQGANGSLELGLCVDLGAGASGVISATSPFAGVFVGLSLHVGYAVH